MLLCRESLTLFHGRSERTRPMVSVERVNERGCLFLLCISFIDCVCCMKLLYARSSCNRDFVTRLLVFTIDIERVRTTRETKRAYFITCTCSVGARFIFQNNGLRNGLRNGRFPPNLERQEYIRKIYSRCTESLNGGVYRATTMYY